MCVVISDTWFDPREKPVQLLIDNDARFCKADATSNAKTPNFCSLAIYRTNICQRFLFNIHQAPDLI